MKYVLLFATALCVASSAYAHVTANPNHGTAGQYFETKFRVSHGCEGSDTISISITLPKGTVVAKPQNKAGWSAAVTKSKLPAPVSAGHGKMTDEQIDEIIWSNGSLPDDQYDEFGVILKLPEKTGETLYFPVVQTCEKGENRWTEIPTGTQQWHDLKLPAPFVKIEAAPKGHAH